MTAADAKPLAGLCVLVTRPKHQAEGLCALIERAGGEVFRFPVLDIEPSARSTQARAILHNLDGVDWIFFVSANAVHFAQQVYGGPMLFPPSLRVAAVGRATARALEQAKIKVDLVPKEQFNSDVLLELSELADLRGARCVIVRGEGGRELLADTLRQRGAAVDYAEVYRRTIPRTDASQLRARLAQGLIHVVTVTSGEALLNLATMVGTAGEALLKETPLVVISQRIRNAASDRGFARVAVAETPADEAVVAAIIDMKIRGKSIARAQS